jgi:hypothetical protein
VWVYFWYNPSRTAANRMAFLWCRRTSTAKWMSWFRYFYLSWRASLPSGWLSKLCVLLRLCSIGQDASSRVEWIVKGWEKLSWAIQNIPRCGFSTGLVFLTIDPRNNVPVVSFTYFYAIVNDLLLVVFSKPLIQGGSNMTGTNCDLFTHKSSRSYLNHLVLSLKSQTFDFALSIGIFTHDDRTEQWYCVLITIGYGRIE